MGKSKYNFSAIELIDLASGYRQSRILLTGLELGVFTILDKGKKTSREAAKILKTDEKATDRLMNALCAMKILKKRNNFFSNSSSSSRYLVEGKPGFLANLFHINNLWENWSTLTKVIYKGGTVSKEPERHRGKKSTSDFIGAMHFFAKSRATKVVALINLKGVKNVLDVGGGSGAYSIEFVRRGKGINAVVFDLPSVIPLTNKYIENEGLGGRIKTVAGDFNINNLGEGFDLVLLSSIIHSNSPDENLRLIKKCYNALNQNGQIVIQDFIMNKDKTIPDFGVLFAINMLVNTEAGDTYTFGEVKAWLEESKFSKIKKKNAPADTTLIIGRKVL